MTNELDLIINYYKVEIKYDFHSKDSFFESIRLLNGYTLKFTDWEDVQMFIRSITPRYIDFLHALEDKL